MMKKLNLETWNRKDHFKFFSGFDDPFFGCTVAVDLTLCKTYCKQENIPLFAFYHYAAIMAVNAVESFRYRIVDNEVVVYDAIHITTTLLRQDKTFSFTYIPFQFNFDAHLNGLEKAQNEIETTTGLGLNEKTGGLDIVHFSTLPWLNFTGLSHAKKLGTEDSCPKISFGKLNTENNKVTMPVAIHVHHALADGYHVGLFVEKFQEFLNHPHELLKKS